MLGSAALAVALGALCFVWPLAGWLIPPVMLCALALALGDLAQLRGGMGALSVRRSLRARVGRGSLFPVTLRIGNSSSTPAVGEARDVLPKEARPDYWSGVFELPPNNEATLRHVLAIPRRGLHRFGPVFIRLRGPFGFLEAQRGFDCPAEVKVMPEGAVGEEGLHKDSLDERRFLDKFRQRRRRGQGMEFESLREYRAGDEPRRIDWRSSARHGRLIVRQFQVEQHRELLIALDCGRLMGPETGEGTKLDRAVDSALMLSRVALKKGDRCGVALFDDKVLGYLPPQSGARAYQAIEESLYEAQSRWRESDFAAMFAALQTRLVKRALVIVLSDLVDVETSERCRGGLAALARRHVVVFVALRTPILDELIRSPVDSQRDIARKAVGMRLARERERTLSALSHSGVQVLDVEPREVTVPLINRYLSIRQRNLL
jgi:uncharacterized protein (DUF58 family)